MSYYASAPDRIATTPIDDGIEITAEQYATALGVLTDPDDKRIISTDGGVFALVDPPAPPEPEPPSPEEALAIVRAAVDAERDRRVATTFQFSGIAYQLDLISQQHIIAKGAQAKFAIADGAQPNDLRWSNPDADFGWIATDNSVTPMDAQTMAAFADAADLWVTAHIMAGHTVKAMEPMPVDVTDDQYWPSAPA